MSRILSVEIPERLYRALESVALREGRSPETVGAAWLIEAITRRTHLLETAGERIPILWKGPQLGLHSFAKVNREICLRLIARGWDLALVPSSPRDPAPRPCAGQDILEAHLNRSPGGEIAAHVRHEWPPSFTPPPEGHWVIIQPWEFGSVPASWVGPMSTLVDEVWAYSGFVRDCYIAAGVPADRVHVVPLGIEPSTFHPNAKPFALKNIKPFRFLFVGGTIHRKGIDLLLKAYGETFTAADPVCLVIKEMGGGSFYRGQTARQQIEQLQARKGAPEIEYVIDELSEDELAGLYVACHCLVQPYRGEGFCLPIAEAMACGLPVIVTGQGAALDYCTAENAYLIPARIVRFREERIGDLETVDYPWLAEPDLGALGDLLRHVVDHVDEAQTKARAGAAFVRSRLTWDHAVDQVAARLAAIQQRPIRRFSAAPATKPARQRVSLCMIVKNEEASLANCLGSVAGLVDETIVVDTGSSDATAALAKRFGARVFPFRWVDSFAAARNESLRHANGDWILWLDADESLDEENRVKLRALLEGLKDENAAYVMAQRSPSGPGQAAMVVDQVRLFRRLAGVSWSYRVHEQILPALRKSGVDLRRSDVVIQHAGHEDSAVRRRRLDRDLRLLVLEIEERPDDPFTLFNLGALYDEIDRPADALPLLERSLQRSRPRDSIVPKLHVLIVRCHRRLGRPNEALEACRKGQEHRPGDVELLFFEALLKRESGDHEGAEKTWLRVLSAPQPAGFANIDDSLRGYKARHHLAVLYEETGRPAEAEGQWRAAVEENPRFAPGWVGLGDLYLKQSRWDDLETVASGLANCPGGSAKADVLRARGNDARRSLTSGCAFESAAPTGALSTAAREDVPQSAPPKISLCMIVKNEEASLASCLASVTGAVDEMIVVDTGSTDRTREIALQWGARVVEKAWVDDFARARNQSIDYATGDWIFWLDADEHLDDANREKLRELFAKLSRENAAYLMQQLSTTDDPHGSRVAVDQVRLFRRDPALRWEYRVHEQILLAIRRAGHDLRRTDIIITHAGYEAQGASERKRRRNLELLLQEDAERPDDPIILYHLGQVLRRLGLHAEALPVLRRSLERMPRDYSIRPRLFGSIARAHQALGQRAEAFGACRAGRDEHPAATELLFLEATLLFEEGDLASAENRLLRLLDLPADQRFSSGDTGLAGYKARHLLAQVYRGQCRLAEARAIWRAIVEEQPRFLPAKEELERVDQSATVDENDRHDPS